MAKHPILYLSIAAFILLLPSLAMDAHAAKISGFAYDYTLSPLDNVVIEVNTSPTQKYIAKDGAYYYDLPPGEYTLTAKYYEDDHLKYFAEEPIEINKDGFFVVDLILLPTEEEPSLIQGINTKVTGFFQNGSLIGYIGLAVGLISLGAVFYVLWRLKRQKHEGPAEEDDVEKQVLGILKKEKRVTQKEIRKRLPMSEAKISLVLSELEERGVLKKIKKGRGNIIVLS